MQIFKFLVYIKGSRKLPRFSCACHKNNIAVRLAIKNDKYLPKVIKRLSSYSAKQKNSISRVKFSIKNKARLRINNKTRWSSDYLVIESHHKGYRRNIFPIEFPCPIRFTALEIYLQILYPAFKFNLIMQRTTSTIADVLPALKIMISKWSRMIVPTKYQDLCHNLILAFKHKFKHELNCPIYHVAALLNVSKLKAWQTRLDCVEMRRKAIDNLVVVAKEFRKEKSGAEIRVESVSALASRSSSMADSLNGLLQDDDYQDTTLIGKKIIIKFFFTKKNN